MRIAALFSFAVTLSIAANASALTYQVGPSRALRELSAVANMLNPGDVVEVDPGTYAAVRFTRPGTTAMPITIRGMVGAGGVRPVVQSGVNTIELAGDNYVVENLDVRGGTARCVFHHADNIVIRNSIVHDCPRQGILGADQDSGDLTLEFVEVHHCGNGTQEHQIYMATDEVAHPGSVFRMQHCYVHDGNGGNAVKSRAERNEIYSNWIEGALYHELELIGPDPGGAPAGWTEATAREDSDVVGNVLRATGTFSIVRVGGDGTGQSRGRYRFVNNTFISNMGGGAVMRVFDAVESIEMHNNVFVSTGGAVNVSRQVEAMWVSGEVFEGSNNWVIAGSTNIPAGFRGTITGASPAFANLAGNDVRPATGSPLIDRGVASTMSPTGRPFVRPLALPVFEPPQRGLTLPGVAIPRATSGVIDIGARESVAASVVDAGAMLDASSAADAGAPPSPDVVVQQDVSIASDAGALVDAAPGLDGATSDDASTRADASTADSGSTPGAMTGCSCATPARSSGDRSSPVFAIAAALTALAHRGRRARGARVRA